jgi:predicted nucleic acid-binding protein
MTPQFLDAGYVIALELSDDQRHDDARDHWIELLKAPGSLSLVTTTYILDEIVTFLNSRKQHTKAVRVGNNLLTASRIQVIHVDEDLFFEGWQYFAGHADKTFSLTDCISFVLMTKLNIAQALTFDKHFVQAGFVKLP